MVRLESGRQRRPRVRGLANRSGVPDHRALRSADARGRRVEFERRRGVPAASEADPIDQRALGEKKSAGPIERKREQTSARAIAHVEVGESILLCRGRLHVLDHLDRESPAAKGRLNFDDRSMTRLRYVANGDDGFIVPAGR